ncbi:cathelicidin antimicrobial peptide isoform X1 [Phyllostomus discolor]|uniref:Cathelicidin antimicrobial peptide isoform X1 n=1 Tax=Phyllostomus discolor TaxID=89673 RepID=A0A7E6E3Y9_9CHIR|nr:cathelicidin antimicrobial peptide isoform X1 [Phyllostomus discolor]
METQRDNLPWGRWSLLLLLLGLAVPPAAAQVLGYNEAVLAAVDGYNQRSSEANLYRLLELDPQSPDADDNPNTPKPVSFTVKETVCPRTTQLPPEQCEFQENGLVKQCAGTVSLDQASGYFDINCEEIQDVILGPALRIGGRIAGRIAGKLIGDAINRHRERNRQRRG